MRFDIITIFPEMFAGLFSGSVIKKALEKGLLEVKVHDLRDYTHDKHRQVDDRPFGGEEGMVLKPEPIFECVEAVRQRQGSVVYLLSPQGRKLDFGLALEIAAFSQVVLICGRYEGVDERVVGHLVDAELSIGDYILTGGEPAAWVVVDAVSRFVPGVVGKTDSVVRESFLNGLLDHPQYTRPRDFRGLKVPQVLFSGDHARIAAWRRKKAVEKTLKSRPDMLESREQSAEDRKEIDHIIKKGNEHEPD